ncbi:hypothetical protein LZ31DRAFT_176600 [Colletotrichum somersetense]|nr:hypothetical protein LZ31DRAFT_176600 [Colletotrichum somersetense]
MLPASLLKNRPAYLLSMVITLIAVKESAKPCVKICVTSQGIHVSVAEYRCPRTLAGVNTDDIKALVGNAPDPTRDGCRRPGLGGGVVMFHSEQTRWVSQMAV